MAGKWMPIESAPISSDPFLRDVEQCLVYGEQTGVKMGRAWRYADGGAQAQADGFSGDWRFTHWMPLPEPPESATQPLPPPNEDAP